MARPGSSRPATARKSDRLNAGSPSSQWLPEPRATGAGTGVSLRREQLWSEQLCPGITTTGLRLTAPRDQKIVERRSEEHTSELQSLMRISYAVFCLKKK